MKKAIVNSPSPPEVFGHGKAAWKEGVVDKIRDLLEAFRTKSLPVIYV